MGLVDYSDSEGSDAETSPPAPKPAPAKPAFPKVINRSEPQKIKVDLPSIKPEPTQQDEEQRPAKRAKTGGAFSGFNSFLPAPKGRVQSGPKPGVSLKTSSEAAFSRAPADPADGVGLVGSNRVGGEVEVAVSEKKEDEPKMVGKATKFRPLSVANNKRKPVKKPKPPGGRAANGADIARAPAEASPSATASENGTEVPAVSETPVPKPKRSLFSVQTEEDPAPEPTNGDGTYESITTTTHQPEPNYSTAQEQPTPQPPDPNSLQSLASDLNLTPAQRRHLFGRHSKSTDPNISIAHFNTDSEYASNEQARQAGEVFEHRAVKAIAPGKHSLKQLVDNARSQQGGLEDKWAEGRRERGEAGGRYGWGGGK